MQSMQWLKRLKPGLPGIFCIGMNRSAALLLSFLAALPLCCSVGLPLCRSATQPLSHSAAQRRPPQALLFPGDQCPFTAGAAEENGDKPG